MDQGVFSTKYSLDTCEKGKHFINMYYNIDFQYTINKNSVQTPINPFVSMNNSRKNGF
jgi:hypothetical protein